MIDLISYYNVQALQYNNGVIEEAEIIIELSDWADFNADTDRPLLPTFASNLKKIQKNDEMIVDEPQNQLAKRPKSKLLGLINKINSKYQSNPLMSQQSKKIYITERDFNLLSKYEKNMIRTIGNIYVIYKHFNFLRSIKRRFRVY